MKKALGNNNLKLAIFAIIVILIFIIIHLTDINSKEWINFDKEKFPDTHTKKALNNNYDECLKSLTPHDCFNEVIVALDDIDECEKFPDYNVYGKPVRDLCIFSFVERTNDYSLCSRIENSVSDRDSCLTFVFFKTKNAALCSVMELSENQANCFAHVRTNADLTTSEYNERIDGLSK